MAVIILWATHQVAQVEFLPQDLQGKHPPVHLHLVQTLRLDSVAWVWLMAHNHILHLLEDEASWMFLQSEEVSWMFHHHFLGGMFLPHHLNPLHEDFQQKEVQAALMVVVDFWLEALAVQVVQAQHLDLPKFGALTAFEHGFITLHNPSVACSVLHPT